MDTETIRSWNPLTRQFDAIQIPVTAGPRYAPSRRAARTGPPRTLAGLDRGGYPLMWDDTAFTDAGPLADTRSYLKPATMRTHRAAVVMPADPGRVSVAGRNMT